MNLDASFLSKRVGYSFVLHDWNEHIMMSDVGPLLDMIYVEHAQLMIVWKRFEHVRGYWG